MAQSLKIHSLVILLALTTGTAFGGIIGAVLSVPIAVVGWAIIRTWNASGDSPDAPLTKDNHAVDDVGADFGDDTTQATT
ncbi:uncharacterized protein DUF20 [Rhodoglobus vestalii]|uniref:Uncharacterized protein DUF20 n=1 Tax=Rhodoglobus vestalii TaxID=193384 RepID=A0A8H2K595_9MICO|nr:uncharacterized protein DUF20 [Rhodoglobus vestalii]